MNTIDEEHGRDDFATAAGYAAWARAAGVAAPAAGELKDARALRGAVRALLLARHDARRPPSSAIETVNEIADAAGVSVRCGSSGSLEIVARRRQPLAEVAASLFEAMSDGSWERLKACRNCTWTFYDASRNRSAMWCSMEICGNRLKARRYRRRRDAARAR